LASEARANAGAGGAGRRQADLGYFLVDDGRDLLERAAHMRRSPLLVARRLGRQFRLATYVGAVVLFAAALAGVLALAWPDLHLHRWVGVAAALVFATCASQLATAVVHWAATL